MFANVLSVLAALITGLDETAVDCSPIVVSAIVTSSSKTVGTTVATDETVVRVRAVLTTGDTCISTDVFPSVPTAGTNASDLETFVKDVPATSVIVTDKVDGVIAVLITRDTDVSWEIFARVLIVLAVLITGLAATSTAVLLRVVMVAENAIITAGCRYEDAFDSVAVVIAVLITGDRGTQDACVPIAVTVSVASAVLVG